MPPTTECPDAAVPLAIDGQTPPPLRVLPHSVDAELEAIWAQQRIARVNERDLRAATHRLIEHHREQGFYGDRFSNMQHITGLGSDASLEVRLAPGRAKPTETTPESTKPCALCNPAEGEKGLRWGDWIIFPNLSPYAPPESEQVVLTSSRHQGQMVNARILRDMMRYQQAAGENTTLHFNGRPVSSRTHLHWHATRLDLPLVQMLEDDSIEMRTWRRTRFGRVRTFARGLLGGIVVTGTPRFVSRWAERLAQRFEVDPRVQGATDMVLLPPRSGRVRLLMVPRRAQELTPDIEGFGPLALRALSFAGLLILPLSELPENIIALADEAAQRSVVHMRELRWLRGLLAESAPLIAFRAQ